MVFVDGFRGAILECSFILFPIRLPRHGSHQPRAAVVLASDDRGR